MEVNEMNGKDLLLLGLTVAIAVLKELNDD